VVEGNPENKNIFLKSIPANDWDYMNGIRLKLGISWGEFIHLMAEAVKKWEERAKGDIRKLSGDGPRFELEFAQLAANVMTPEFLGILIPYLSKMRDDMLRKRKYPPEDAIDNVTDYYQEIPLPPGRIG